VTADVNLDEPVAVPIAAVIAAGTDPLAGARAWFATQGWSPFPFQEEVWSAFAGGRSGLLHAPTGMGKTYAAWIPPLVLGPDGAVDAPPLLTVLWITPLRALAADTGLALARAACALQPHWTVDVRTGDTAPSARAPEQAAAHGARHHARESHAAADARRLARTPCASVRRHRRRVA